MASFLQKEGKEDLKQMVTCLICSDLLTEPRQCVKCENNFCKKCIEKWMERSNSCPMRCSNPSFKESRMTNNILSLFKPESCKETIVVIGETGVGKSTLCNLLIGREEFVAGKGLDLSTKEAKSAEGISNYSKIRVIDTQGYNDPNGCDIENTRQMINLIKSVKSVKAFLLVINGQNMRWNEGTWSVLKLFDKMFPNFWDNAIFVINFWSSDPYSEKIRKAGGRDELFLKGEIMEKIKSKFGENTIMIIFLNASDAKLGEFSEYQKNLKSKICDLQKMWSFFKEYDTSSLVEKKQSKDELIDKLKRQKMELDKRVKENEKKSSILENNSIIAEQQLKLVKEAESQRIKAQNELEKLKHL